MTTTLTKTLLEDFHQRAELYNQNGILGTLSGITQKERDGLVQELHLQLKQQLELAQSAPPEESWELDISPLSGVNEGDFLRYCPQNGKIERQLKPYPETRALLKQYAQECLASQPTLPTWDGDPCAPPPPWLRTLLLRAAYNGLWSPSGTNWQPMRMLECSASQMRRLRKAAGLSELAAPPGAAIIARRTYCSILSDIAHICLYTPRSKADAIDIGIYLLACELSVFAYGATPHLDSIPSTKQHPVNQELLSILQEQQHALEELNTPHAQTEREKLEWLIAQVQNDEAFVDTLFSVVPPKPNWCPPLDQKSHFDHLIEARSSQRVASPNKDMSVEEFDDLWREALALLGENQNSVHYTAFSWHHDMPSQIGQGMHEGLYGKGADPLTGRDGEGGYLSAANLDTILEWISQNTDTLPAPIQQLILSPPELREEVAKQTPFPRFAIPAYLEKFLLDGGRYTATDEYIVDRRQQPLSVGMFLRIVRHMLNGFGSFFLRFQNTHPITAILLTKEDELDPFPMYKALGRMSLALTLLCRCVGLTSIIKEGTIEFAAELIQELVIQHMPDRETAQKVAAGQYMSRLTFQVGHPLDFNDEIQGGPQKHTGLDERLKDRRPPHSPIARHYYPSIAPGKAT